MRYEIYEMTAETTYLILKITKKKEKKEEIQTPKHVSNSSCSKEEEKAF